MNLQLEQQQFMTACDQPHHMYPVAPEALDKDQVLLWMKLIIEEHQEFLHELRELLMSNSENHYDVMTKVLHEGVDTVYVLCGMMNYLGLPLMTGFREIHQANMRKVVDGKVIRREDGKILKPEGWKPADLFNVVMESRDYKS